MNRVLAVMMTVAVACGCRPGGRCPDPLPCSCPDAESGEVADTVAEVDAPPVGSGTRVVVLGSGTPIPDPDRSGPSVAVVTGGRAYVVDFGPGVVRRAQEAYLMGYDELEATRLDIAFCTHLHSDHTAGLPDLLLTPWVVGRDAPLELYGPPGLEKMARHVVEAWHEDIQVRVKGNQPHEDLGWQVRVHEVEPGKIYDDGVVEVTAFEVAHGAWETAYAYRFDASDRSVVISGDTTPTDAIVEACDGCDVLVHEVYAKRGFDMRDPGWQEYHRSSHTSSLELAEIATRAKPKLLVLYHQLLWGATREELMDEIRSGWDGEVAWADDLDVF